MCNKIKYALIGCGRIAPNHVGAAVSHSEYLNFTAVCDLVPQKMERSLSILKDSKQIKRYKDYREMLGAERPELVAVATESGNHAEITLDCIAAGCHVIVEKPIAMSLSDADQMILAANKKGVLLSVCHQNRFNRSIQKIRNALEKGDFGRLYYAAAHVLWHRDQGYYKQAPWRGTWEQDGGTLMNQCIHNIDLLRWMMGEIDEVFSYTARQLHPYIETEDLGLGLVRFKSGAYGLIAGTTNVYPENLEETLYLLGENGTVKAGGKSVNLIEEWKIKGSEGLEDEIKKKYSENPPNIYGFGHSKLYKDVIYAVQNGKEPYVDGYGGRRALELILAMYLSAKQGKPVKFPLKECSTTDFAGRFNV